MSYSTDYQYRNVFAPEPERPPRKIGVYLVIGALLLCCVCCGLLIGVQWGTGYPLKWLPSSASATPTRDPNAPVALKTPTTGANGIVLTAIGFQRPLKVEGAKIAADQEFALVTVRVRNTRTSGDPIKVAPADFTLTGDGGLTYAPNPKGVTIKNLMTDSSLAPGKEVEAELIFQIAGNDSGLKLIWNAGGTKRTIALEPSP